jgi:hypothetical protein
VREQEQGACDLPIDDVGFLIKDTIFLSVSVSMHSLFPRGHEPSYVMLRKTVSEEYLEFSDMAQWCCSRFQRSILQRFFLQGRIGYGFPIRLSKDWMCSSGKCWPNTEVDDLMKLIALSRLSLRCFGF